MELTAVVINLAIVDQDSGKAEVTLRIEESGSAFKFQTLKNEHQLGDTVTITIAPA